MRNGSATQGFARIGCAGWSIPAAHHASFDEGESVLARYATRFNAVEVNSSFYRSHQPGTYARWAETVPRDFRFSVKMPRAITHEARLRYAEPTIGAFFDEIAGLGAKLGVVLIQLPPSLKFDVRIAEEFFANVRSHFGRAVAFEPRHPTWFDTDADALCVDHRIARVAADPPPVPVAARPAGTNSLRYWRWHGSPRIYHSAYDDTRLRQLAAGVIDDDVRDTWCVFDNTAHGHAIADALKLQTLLKRRAATRADADA